MNRGRIARACSLAFALITLNACGKQAGRTAAPERAATDSLASSNMGESARAHDSAWRCPNRVHGSVVSSIRTKRGTHVVFSAQGLPARQELQRRARELVVMYNSVYGQDGERTSWAKWSAAPDGARVEFSIFTEPDLDPKVEPIPEQSEARLRDLRERIGDYVVRMQAGEPCPLMRDLAELGAQAPRPLARDQI